MPVKIKPILPEAFNDDAFWDEYGKLVHDIGDDMLTDFENTTKNWEHQPIFALKFPVDRSASIVEITTDDVIYGFVSEGTRPHEIAAVNAPALVFLPGFKAKTTPGKIESGTGFPGAPPPIRTQIVQHPGSKGRKFDELIAKKWTPVFKQRAEKATAAGVQKSKHAIT